MTNFVSARGLHKGAWITEPLQSGTKISGTHSFLKDFVPPSPMITMLTNVSFKHLNIVERGERGLFTSVSTVLTPIVGTQLTHLKKVKLFGYMLLISFIFDVNELYRLCVYE